MKLDNVLYGLARANHVHYLSENWDEGATLAQKVVGYPFGMGEHLLYAMWKAVAIATLILVDLGLAIHYLVTKDDSTLQRLKVGVLALNDAVMGLVVDAIGVVCPPLAYRIDALFEEMITDQWCAKLGIPKEPAINFFSKVF